MAAPGADAGPGPGHDDDRDSGPGPGGADDRKVPVLSHGISFVHRQVHGVQAAAHDGEQQEEFHPNKEPPSIAGAYDAVGR